MSRHQPAQTPFRGREKVVNRQEKPSIGIVGAGTVGQALIGAFEGRAELQVNDPERGAASVPLSALALGCEAVFIAVPTPLDAGGDADVSAFESVVEELNAVLMHNGLPDSSFPVLCVRSAVPPDKVAEAGSRWPRMRVVVSPEFLREASPQEDMLNMVSLVLGGDLVACEVIVSLFRHHSNVAGPMRVSILPDAIGAAFLKYQENAFLAMKVSFMNEFFDVFSRSGSATSWDQLQTAFHQDHERMGSTHWSVPGPDGLRGWGGRCLPKDVSAFRQYSARMGLDTPLLGAVWHRNMADRGRNLGEAVFKSLPKRERTTAEKQSIDWESA
jgi:UDPglucose 6-dehydrogenase